MHHGANDMWQDNGGKDVDAKHGFVIIQGVVGGRNVPHGGRIRIGGESGLPYPRIPAFPGRPGAILGRLWLNIKVL